MTETHSLPLHVKTLDTASAPPSARPYFRCAASALMCEASSTSTHRTSYAASAARARADSIGQRRAL
jgi:hypothetical protein